MSTEEIINSHEFDDLKKKVVDGVGKDAEVVTNSRGGKQSKTPMALHLVDPEFLYYWAENYGYKTEGIQDNRYLAIREVASYMKGLNMDHLVSAMYHLEQDPTQRLVRIAKVLQYGADRYEANNWRLIPQESHINHALIHILADIMGDTQDDHLDHALCRLMMAMSTEKSEGFDYNKYVSKVKLKLDTPPQISFDVDNSKPTCSYKYDCHYKENK